MAPDNFYRTFYSAGDPRRIVAREHTSMLTGQATAEVREWIQGRLRGPLGSKRPRRHAHP